MGKYWMVVPNPSQPNLAVEFEIVGDVHTVTNMNEAIAISEEHGHPTAVVIGVPVDGIKQRVEWFRGQYPHVPLYLAGNISPFQLAGLDIKGVVPMPLQPEFIQGLQGETRPALVREHDPWFTPIPPTPAQPGEETKPREARGKEQFIVVLGGKGGVGKTTVASQLGILCAKHGSSTLIIDVDYQGNQAEWFRGMNQPPIHSILDFREDMERDKALLDSFLMEKNGLKILPCPQVNVGPIPPDLLDRAIRAYKPYFEVIILDMHAGFSPDLLQAAQYANKFVAVTLSSEKQIYPFSVTLNQLLSHRISKKNLHIVVNRSHRGEADIRKVRTGLQDLIGESFSRYHVLPWSEDLSYDDDPDFVPVSDMKMSDSYPTAFIKMAEAVTELSLRKRDSDKSPTNSSATRTKKSGATKQVSWVSKLLGTSNTKKKKKRSGSRR